MLDGVESLQFQAPITLLIHPNSDTIMELSCKSGTLLTFDDSARRLAGDTMLFTALGILMYAAALGGLYALIRQWRRKKRTHSPKQ